MTVKLRLQKSTKGNIEIKVNGESFRFNAVSGRKIVILEKLKQMNQNDRVSMFFKITSSKRLGRCSMTYQCSFCPYNENEKCVRKR
jgi:hypothetical protein